MVVQQRDVKGGIAAVVEGYYGSRLERDFCINYVESYCDGSKLKKLIKALTGYFSFAVKIFRFKPDIVHIHSSFGPSFYRMQPFIYMARLAGVPIVNHCHGADFDTFYVKASAQKKKRIREVYSKCDRIIVLSDEWKERFLDIVDGDRLVVINNYCKPLDPERVRRLSDKRFSGKRVLFLGEIGRRKGGYDFADIIAKTAQKVPGVRFDICGDGATADVAAIRKAVREKADGTKVSFPGWVRGDRRQKELEHAAVFMLPSYQEGMPMAILDAMAYGLPVVSTNVGGIPKLVTEGCGYLAEPGDTDAIADSIARLLLDKEVYALASSKSAEHAAKNYGFEAHIDRIEAVYRSIGG